MKTISTNQQLKFGLKLLLAISFLIEIASFQIMPNIPFFRILFFTILFLQATLIIILCIVFLIRYQVIKRGLKTAIGLHLLKASIEKELLQGNIYFNYRQSGKLKIVKLPKITFHYDKNNTLIILIKNSVKYQNKLEDLDISSALKKYVVERQYLSDDRNYMIYETYTVSTQQLIFDDRNEYQEWCNNTVDDYAIRMDERLTIPFCHVGLASQTGGGKTFLLQMLIYQLASKTIEHELYISDVKRSDLYYLAKKLKDKGYKVHYADASNTVEIINHFYNRMLKRQTELEDFLSSNPNKTYQEAKLPAIIFIGDEWAATQNSWTVSLSKKERDEVQSQLDNCIFMGRQLGCFCWFATQQMNANTLKTSISDQLLFKIVLSSSDEQTYRTMFSSSVRIPKVNFKPGQGVFSYPQVATIDSPKLLNLPYCKFLEDIF